MAAWYPSAYSQRVLKWTRYGSLRCEPFGLSIQVAFLEVQKCDLRFFYQTIRTFYFFPREFLSFIEIDLDFYWVGRGRMCDTFRPRSTTSVHGRQLPFTVDNFRPQSTASVHGRQLLSTSASPKYLIHCFQQIKRKETQFNQVMIISEIQGQYGEWYSWK